MKKILLLLFTVFILLSAGMAQADSVWNLANDYSTTDNPDGVWSYGYMSSEMGVAFTAYDSTRSMSSAGLATSVEWYSSTSHASDYCPSIWKNTDAGTYYNVASGQVSIHPGTGGYPFYDTYLSVVRWTASTAMTISVSGFFGAGDVGPMSYYIYLNGTLIFSQVSDFETATFSFSDIIVNAGDTLDFAVGDDLIYGYGGGYGNTPLDVTITSSSAVPEPATTLLLCLGLMGLVGVRRKFKR